MTPHVFDANVAVPYRDELEGNPRLNLTLALLDKRDPQDMQTIRAQAARVRDKLRQGERI